VTAEFTILSNSTDFVFKTLHFLLNLRMGPINSSVLNWQAFLLMQHSSLLGSLLSCEEKKCF
jgi:hypothetical protein